MTRSKFISFKPKFAYFHHYLEAWLHQQKRGRTEAPARVQGAPITGHLWQVRL